MVLKIKLIPFFFSCALTMDEKSQPPAYNSPGYQGQPQPTTVYGVQAQTVTYTTQPAVQHHTTVVPAAPSVSQTGFFCELSILN